MATIKISGDLQNLAALLSGRGGSLRPAIASGAVAIKRTIEDFYRSMPGRSFFKSVVSGNKVAIDSLNENSATVVIDSYELAHHIRGGTVKPIPPRVNISIPLTDEARAAGYPSNRRIKGIFRPGHIKGVPNSGKHVLAVKDGKSFRVLWALAESVEHQPHPEAEVPDELLSASADTAMRGAILRALRK